MNKSIYILLLLSVTIGLSSCRTAAPRLDYKALARASVRLGMDIDQQDNHKLYIEAANWIGVPYRGGGETKRGTDCSGFTCQIYKKVYNTQLPRNTEGQKKESAKVTRRNLREGDLVFFTSRKSGKKVAHVGIYLKDNKFVHASTSRGVIVSHLDEQYYRTHWIAGGRPAIR
ncbi:C40 family peptidase [Bacteroides sp.]